MKILIAGFQHETNTFAPTKAVYESFVQGGGFPALCRDEALLELEKVNIPIGGFIGSSSLGVEFPPELGQDMTSTTTGGTT
mgnify:CR=1 FL=1|jgi:microcystin degradation protein MlrC